MLTRSILSAAAFSLAACATAPSIAQDQQRDDAGNAATTANAAFAETAAQGRPVKVMIITMFGPEGQAWLDRLGPWRDVAVPGLSPDYPVVHCNRQDVCVVTTGMGYANASATIMALTFSPRFDLRRTYFLVSGIAASTPRRARSVPRRGRNTSSISACSGSSTRARFPPAGTPAFSASTRRARTTSRRSTTAPKCSSSTRS